MDKNNNNTLLVKNVISIKELVWEINHYKYKKIFFNYLYCYGNLGQLWHIVFWSSTLQVDLIFALNFSSQTLRVNKIS